MADPVRCHLCQPPELIGDGDIFNHLRLLHLAAYEGLQSDRGPLTDTVPEMPVVTAEDVQAGERCCRCRRLFQLGERYAEILHGLVGEIPVVEVICLECSEKASADA